MKKAVVLFSGGQDSMVTLYQALADGFEVTALIINYGQKHARELDCAKLIVKASPITKYMFLHTGMITSLVTSSLTQGAHTSRSDGLPDTFVPGRNIIMLSLAGALAYEIGAGNIYIGVNQQDYSGYPDCRASFISAMQFALTVGLDKSIVIWAPLQFLSKKEIVLKAVDLNCFEMFKHTHTCYKGDHPPCGTCASCLLRAKGFKEANLEDPLLAD